MTASAHRKGTQAYRAAQRERNCARKARRPETAANLYFRADMIELGAYLIHLQATSEIKNYGRA